MVSSFAQVPDAALTDLVGTLRNGSPLRTLLDELGPAASQAVREGLVQGVGAGMGSRQIARRIRGALGGDLTRALTISRTETLRSYRESTRRNYVANRDVVTGWIWMAAKDMRTCASCWAMDGTVHRLEERMSDHPNGRCAALPALRDLDVTDGRAWGADAFAEMSADQQRGVLGQAGYEAFRAGAVSLSDFVGVTKSRAWGTTRSARSLSSILGAGEAKKYADRVGVLRALGKTDIGQTVETIRAERDLPKLNYHFDKHGADLQAGSAGEYLEKMREHLNRPSLEFAAVRRKQQGDTMWYAYDVDSGDVAQYNQERGKLWSFYRSRDINKLLKDSGAVSVKRVGNRWEVK